MSADESLWTWQFLDEPGTADAGPSAADAGPGWHSRFDAETWLGEHWRELAAAGARRALLRHGDEPVGSGVELRAFRDPTASGTASGDRTEA